MKHSFAWPIIGHKNIVQYLQNSILNGRVNHAYLFVGQKSIGKSTLASYFAQTLLCSSSQDKKEYPCGECDHCRQFKNNIHPDVIKVVRDEEDKNVTIDQIREVINKLSLKSFIAKYKIAIIDDADYMTEEAANALLKTLEEPSGQTVIILLANNANNLPTTIVSRCQTVRFLPVDKNTINDYLNSQGKIDKDTLESMSRLSRGLPGVVSFWLKNKQDWEEYVIELRTKLKSLEKPLYINWQDNKKNLSRSMVYNQKLQLLENDLNQWLYIFRDLLLVASGNDKQVAHYFMLNELTRFAHRIGKEKIQKVLNSLIRTKKQLVNNPNIELTLENLFLNITH